MKLQNCLNVAFATWFLLYAFYCLKYCYKEKVSIGIKITVIDLKCDTNSNVIVLYRKQNHAYYYLK